MPTLTARPIDRESFAPYGWLIEAPAGQAATAGRPINGGSSLRIDGLSELALNAAGGMPCLSLFVACTLHVRWRQRSARRAAQAAGG